MGGTNTYTGLTTVSSGTLTAASTASLPGYATAGSVSVAAGATLGVCPASATNLTSGWTAAAIATLLTGPGPTFASGANIGFDTTYGSFTYANSLPATSLGLVKNGTNTLVLTASNTYTGGTTIAAGTLQLGDGVNNNGSTSGNIVDNATLALANPAAQTLTNVTSGSGGLVMVGSGTMTLSAADVYSGGTTINGGTLRLGPGGTLPGGTALSLANAAGATFNLNGYNQTIGTLAGGGAAGGSVNLGAGGGNLTVGGNGASMTYAGASPAPAR